MRGSLLHLGVNRKQVIILSLLIVAWIVSTYIHDPSTSVLMNNFGFKYTDIVHGLFQTIFQQGSRDRWYDVKTYMDFLYSNYKCPKPYIDYKFEYPPIIGALWYASTCIGFTTSTGLESAARIHFYVNSLITLISLVSIVILLFKIKSKQFLFDNDYYRYLLFITPSTVLYLVYNWDIVAALFSIIGVLFFINKKYFEAGVFLGLSISSKILTAGLAFYFLVKLLMEEKSNRYLLRYIVGLIIAGLIPYLTLYIVTPRGFTDFINHHASWYCENCLYLPLTRDIYSDLNRKLYFSIGTCYMFILATLLSPWHGIKLHVEFKYYLESVMVLVLFNYVFSPQMLLMITPFAVLALNKPYIYMYLMADIFNALIILFFFTESSPWTYGSITQYAAFARNFVLLLIWIIILFEITISKIKALSNIGE